MVPDSPVERGLWSGGGSHRIVGVNGRYIGRDGKTSGLSTRDSEAHSGRGWVINPLNYQRQRCRGTSEVPQSRRRVKDEGEV